jgi:hypothetical protein
VPGPLRRASAPALRSHTPSLDRTGRRPDRVGRRGREEAEPRRPVGPALEGVHEPGFLRAPRKEQRQRSSKPRPSCVLRPAGCRLLSSSRSSSHTPAPPKAAFRASINGTEHASAPLEYPQRTSGKPGGPFCQVARPRPAVGAPGLPREVINAPLRVLPEHRLSRPGRLASSYGVTSFLAAPWLLPNTFAALIRK